MDVVQVFAKLFQISLLYVVWFMWENAKYATHFLRNYNSYYWIYFIWYESMNKKQNTFGLSALIATTLSKLILWRCSILLFTIWLYLFFPMTKWQVLFSECGNFVSHKCAQQLSDPSISIFFAYESYFLPFMKSWMLSWSPLAQSSQAIVKPL